MSTSEALTRGIRVSAQSVFVPERSDPDENRWFYAYTVRITNEGDEAVQLLTRHWVITDANGRVEEVRGPGVVGQQPVLKPGDSFQYTSACPLQTSFGTMHGSYQMVVNDTGERFDAEVGLFPLGEPEVIH